MPTRDYKSDIVLNEFVICIYAITLRGLNLRDRKQVDLQLPRRFLFKGAAK